MNVTIGRIVLFFPSERTKRTKFPTAKEDKKSFAAIVNDVNADSVDLSVFSGKGVVEVTRAQHTDVAGADRSSWEFPIIK